MTHFQDEGHYQEHKNAQAQAEMEAMMHQAEGEAMAELNAQSECKQEPQPDWSAIGEIRPEAPDTELKEAMTPPKLTLGERLVGITFNPSGDSEVNKIKELFANITDTMLNAMEGKEMSLLHRTLIDHAICEILNAQMNVVKVLTFKL
jgi:hypothetical protein